MTARLHTCFLFSWLLSALLITLGCTGIYYKPNAVHAPLLGYKHDFDVNTAVRLVDDGDFNLQSAYAPLDHFEVVLNGMTSTTRYSGYEKKHRFLEAGAGVFQAFGKESENKPFRAELIGGYGIGVGSEVNGDSKAIGRYQRKFLQPAIGVKLQNLDFSFGLRIAEVNFSNYSVYYQRALLDKGIYDFSTVEPNFRLSVGLKHVKVGGQISSIRALRNKEAYKAASGFDSYDVNTNFDLFISFNPWKDKIYNLGFYNLDTNSLNAIELNIRNNPCWICLPKTAKYADVITFELNSIEVDYAHKTRDLICHRLQFGSQDRNLLSIAPKRQAPPLKTPIHLILRDGNANNDFYIDLSDGTPKLLYLTH